jgi:hypothetical protein
MSHWKIGPNGTTFLILLQHCKNHEQLEDIWNKTLKYRLCKIKVARRNYKDMLYKTFFNKSLTYENQHNMENMEMEYQNALIIFLEFLKERNIVN